MWILHLILKNSFCCHCHCFVLTCVCHHPPHSQRIDKNPLSWRNVYFKVKCFFQLCLHIIATMPSNKGEKSLKSLIKLKFKYPPSLSPLLLYPALQVHLTSFALRITKGPSLPVFSIGCQSPIFSLQLPYHHSTTILQRIMDYIIPQAQTLTCKAHMHPSCSQVLMVGRLMG